MIGNSPEKRLLLLSARLELDGEHEDEFREVLKDSNLDWEEVLHNAQWHRLSGLILHHIRGEGFADLVPASVLQDLKAVYVQNTVKNIYLRSELRKVLRLINEKSIPVMVLKGATLLETIYQNTALRPMSDIDLLVPEDKADEVQAMVMGLGYNPVGTPEAQARTREMHRHLPSLVDKDGTAAFEIHSHLVTKDSPLRFDLSDMWARARQATIVDEEVLIPSPEHMLTHLAIHFFLDRRFRSYAALGQLCDMAEVIRYHVEEIDWDYMAKEVNEKGLQGPVYCALSLAQELIDTPVPQSFLDEIMPQGFSASSARLFTQRRVLDTRPVLASSLITPLSDYSIPNLAKSMVTRLFPNRTYMSEHYAGTVESKGIYTSYLHRLGQFGTALGMYVRNPRELWQQFQVDRWIHSMQYEARQEAETSRTAVQR